MMPTIRPERADDIGGVDELLLDAFPDAPIVATLARRLRTDGLHVPSLTFVAVHDGRLVGQVMLSRVEVVDDDGARWQALNLTPLAVDPPHQGLGVGSALVHHAIAAAGRDGDFPVVLLEGDPGYYRRFGFVRASTIGIGRPSPRIPDEAFQVVTLSTYDATRHLGDVVYPEVFHELDAIGP